MLGQDNEEIFENILGLDKEKIHKLAEEGII